LENELDLEGKEAIERLLQSEEQIIVLLDQTVAQYREVEAILLANREKTLASSQREYLPHIDEASRQVLAEKHPLFLTPHVETVFKQYRKRLKYLKPPGSEKALTELRTLFADYLAGNANSTLSALDRAIASVQRQLESLERVRRDKLEAIDSLKALGM
jgi:hypothetical protein